MDAVPDGEWFCPDCEDDPGAPVGAWAVKKGKGKGKPKTKRAEAQLDDEDAETGGKRKAPAKSKAGGRLLIL